MTGRTSGLQRDVEIIRRRAWLFLPFLLLGIIVAIALSLRSSGSSTATATMQLQTSIYDLTSGGDRGFRVYDAQAMTRLPQFRDEVINAIGDKNFNYGRFGIILNPNATAEGVSSGSLVVTITDKSLANAEKYRTAFVDTFNKEFTSPDGLFHKAFIQQQLNVSAAAESQYQAAYQKLQSIAQKDGITVPLAQIARADQTDNYLDQLGRNRANMVSEQSQAQAALDSIGSSSSGAAAALASSILQQPVSAGDATAALQAHVASLKAAIAALDDQIAQASGASLPADFRAQLDLVRGFENMRASAASSVTNAQAADTSAISSSDTSYTTSGGRINSTLGLVAIVIGITIVFGLIAIYLLEWLSQLRAPRPGEA